MKAAAGHLAALPLFAVLRADELDAAVALFALRSIPKNAIIASEGEDVATVGFIVSGQVKLFWRDSEDHQVDLAVIGAGESITNSALLGAPLVVSLMATEPVVLVVIRREDFEALLLRHPQLAVAFAKDMIRIVRNLIERVRMLGMEDVHGRVVWLLLRRATLNEGRLVTDRMTQEDIGRRVGATREMVGRVLRDLQSGGYIAASGGRFTVLHAPPRRR